MGGKARARRLLNVEQKQVQLPRGRDTGILLPQRAGRRVAGIFGELASRLHLRLHQLLEGGVGHIDLAAHLQQGQIGGNGLGNRGDGREIRRHILAGHAVPPRRTADETPVGVFEGHRKTVDLRLHRIRNGSDGASHPLVKGIQLLDRKHVLQALHLDPMLDAREGVHRRAADMLRRGCGGNQRRVFPLHILDPGHQLIVFVVGNGRVILDIIAAAVFLRQPAEFPIPPFALLFHGSSRQFCFRTILYSS